jgi:hypothetical protein
LLHDRKLIKHLNPLAGKPSSPVLSDGHSAHDVADLMAAARQYVESQINALDLPFALPAIESLACLVPGETETHGIQQTD